MRTTKLNKYIASAAVLFFLGTLFPYAYAAVDHGMKKLRLLVDVIEFVKENYVEEMQMEQLVTGAIKGVAGELDDFSAYMPPKDYKELKNDTKGEFGGLGMRLQQIDDFITVMTPMPGTPAFNARIMPQDRILAVDGKDLTGVPLDEAVALMRGKAGSKVKLTLSRKNDKGKYETLPEMVLKRAIIVPEVVYHRMLKNGVGYLYLVDFSGHSTDEVKKALTDLKKKGMTSLVLDLRFNPGGLLNGAVDLSKLFLPAGEMIVYTQGRKPEYYQEYKTELDPLYPDLPIAVLINQGSASASEIVSGALQDNGRAFIVGQRSFGKASVQQVLPLSGGAGLRLTIAKYYTPSGRLIQRNYRDKTKADEGGIIPDVEIIVKPEKEAKIFGQYNEIIYTPGKAAKLPEFKEEDLVLDKAVEILTGKITLQEAKEQSKKAAEERKKQKEAKQTDQTEDKEKKEPQEEKEGHK